MTFAQLISGGVLCLKKWLDAIDRHTCHQRISWFLSGFSFEFSFVALGRIVALNLLHADSTVSATHLAAGPPSLCACRAVDGVHQPSPHSAHRTASVQDKARSVLVLGLTKFYRFIGLANSRCFAGLLYGSHLVGLNSGQNSPDHPGGFVGHANPGHTVGLA